MPKGQKPYKKEEKDFGQKLRAGLSKLRGPVEEIGKKVQGIAGPLANRHPDKKAKGGMVKKAKGRKC